MTRSRIVAVDFDGTLCEDNYPKIGEANEELIEYLKAWKKWGGKLILWTCRNGGKLLDAVEWCEKRGLIFDAVNENLPEIIDQVGGDTRKIFADEYIDDKNVNMYLLDGKHEGISPNWYQEQAMQFASFSKEELNDMVAHAIFGLCSEAGEVAGIFQKMYLGHPFDLEHLKRELGDCLWMIAEACTAFQMGMEDVMRTNLLKLKERYPNGFELDKSLHRKSTDI